jgi:hypothetical protein
MDRFTHLRSLRVGDVLQVPLLLPHALLHGVRVIEFQTPSYERKILSFGQKVLTQDHWDTREAVERMLLAPPPAALPQRELKAAGVWVERIIDFPDFEGERISIQPGVSWLAPVETTYRLLIVVSGGLEAEGGRYGAENALLLPRHWQGALRASQASAQLVFLLVRPRP